MAHVEQFNLPDLGEGLTEGEILRWLVAEGETVTLNQPIVEVETAKAAVEIPSPFDGTIAALLVEAGSVIETGTPIIRITTAGAGAAAEAADTPPAVAAGTDGPKPQRTAVLVGYGPAESATTRRPRRRPAPASAPNGGSSGQLLPTIPDALDSAAKPMRHGGLEMGRATAARFAGDAGAALPDADAIVAASSSSASSRPRAKPPVRKLARDLGVELSAVPGSGNDGIVTRDDVLAFQRDADAPPPATTERELRVPIKGVRRLTADAMVRSAFTAPHVTCFLDVDMTATMALIERLRQQKSYADIRIGPLLITAKAALAALRRQPELNSTWDESSGEIVVKRYVNLGIAAATDRGLLVPNIKDADQLSTPELAQALTALAQTARAGKTTPAEMSGGTFTITNIGVFGVDAGTPIIPPGEAAILALGAATQRPWVVDDAVVPRTVTTLAVSFDHRIVDGEQGSRFLRDVGDFLTDPGLALLTWQ